MTYLLDTHTLIWAITAPEKLSRKVREILENPEERIVISAITFWEISLKYAIGKLKLENFRPDDLPEICHQMDIEVLPLDAATCSSSHLLQSAHHRDPFDRMLIWLAKSSNFILLSKDASIKLYESEGIQVLW